MRKLRLFSIAALTLAMAACSSEENTLETQSPAAPGKLHFTATIATPDNGAGTRTEYSEQADGTINVAWKQDDEIAIVNDVNPGTNYKMTVGTVNTIDGSATISGDITGNDGAAVTAYYPYSAQEDWTTFTGKFQSQDGTLKYIQDNLDYRIGYGTLSVSGTQATLKEALSMNSKIAILKLTLQDNAATPNALKATKVAVKNGDEVIAATATLGTATSTVYLGVLLTSNITGANITIEATVGSDTYTFTKEGVSLTAGQYYQSTVKMTKPVDLSMVDNAGNPRDKQWTANCYMVHKAGDYKLPLVYGNAIKAGEDNKKAYNPGGSTSDTYCANFVNHAGTAINAPWITKATTGEGVAKGMGITVKSAALLWQDAEGLITKVGISGDYLTLTVGKDATTQQGNALVAAKDADGKIVWSWHIWVTKETFADATLTTVATTDNTSTGTQGVDWQIYKVTPVNLGWVPTDGNGKKGYAPYYQWGRKDALIPGDGATFTAPSISHTVYDIDGNEITGMTNTASTTATIADNIKNPTTHYYNDDTKGPCNTRYYNMWDAQQTGANNIKTATKKTVYDPSPAGFCVPTDNLYYLMGHGNVCDGGYNRSDSDWDTTNKGKTWKQTTYSNYTTGPDLYFPASGFRDPNNGSTRVVGQFGYYWSSSPKDGNTGRYLGVHQGLWWWTCPERANGYPVRAVAEE